MLKKIMMLALAAMAVLAVSAPAASANWLKHHSAIQTNETVTFTGQAKFNSLVVGSIECQTQAKVQFLASQTTAEIEEFAIDAGNTPTERCVTGGPLQTCDVTNATADATTQAPWIAHLLQNKDTINITTGTIQNHLEGIDSQAQNHTACNVVQTIQLKPAGSDLKKETFVHATVPAGASTCTISSVNLSGQLETATGAKVTITGSQNVGTGATYGTQCP